MISHLAQIYIQFIAVKLAILERRDPTNCVIVFAFVFSSSHTFRRIFSKVDIMYMPFMPTTKKESLVSLFGSFIENTRSSRTFGLREQKVEETLSGHALRFFRFLRQLFVFTTDAIVYCIIEFTISNTGFHFFTLQLLTH